MGYTRGFTELDHCVTEMGELTLRRRRDPVVDRDVYEVRLGDEYLMSSTFTHAEEELSRLALAHAPDRDLRVVVGGLGLGYTAVAALDDHRVGRLTVVEALEPVIRWHRQALLPVSPRLLDDRRVELVHGDFFAMTASGSLQDVGTSRSACDVVLLDIDHTPDHLLHPSHGGFYTEAGLHALTDQLSADGVFGLWSDDPPQDGFLDLLHHVFHEVEAQVVEFANPYTGGSSSNTVYVARLVGTRPT
jgi:spermidine synthase